MELIASLGESFVLLAVPWSRIFDSVTAVGSQPRRHRGLSSQMWSKILVIFQVGREKGIAGVVGADSTACTGGGAHSPASDSISSEEARDTCPAVPAAATSLALRASQTQEAQAK